MRRQVPKDNDWILCRKKAHQTGLICPVKSR
jgi:hypothetical protein